MANSIYGTIKVETAEDRCYFHVLGDCVEYGDLESLVEAHPELEDIVKLHKFELKRELMQHKELLGIA